MAGIWDKENPSQDAKKISQLPILPPDVLIEIFTTPPASGVRGDRPDNIPLLAGSVCRYWRDVVLGTPIVWTNMTANSASVYHPNLYLQRSSPCRFNLHLYFDNSSLFHSQFMKALRLSLTLHYQRLDELFIFYYARDEAFGETLSVLQALDSLNIRVLYVNAMYHAPVPYFWSATGVVLQTMFPPMPNLTFCKLPSQFVMMLNPAYTFEYLTTFWITDNLFPYFNFSRSLGRLPALKTLILQNMDFRARNPGGDSTPIVTVPSLSNLVVHFNWHPSLSSWCCCTLGSLMALNLEVLELGLFFMVADDEDELLEFQEKSLHEWRKLESKLKRIVFHGVLDPWHNGNMRIVKLLRKPLHVGYKGFKGKVLSASPIKEDHVEDLRTVRSLSLDYTHLKGQNVYEALYRLGQMVDLLLPLCPPVTARLSEGMQDHIVVLELREKFEGFIDFRFGDKAENEYWGIPRI